VVSVSAPIRVIRGQKQIPFVKFDYDYDAGAKWREARHVPRATFGDHDEDIKPRRRKC
jgi:hypothetical protein